LPGRTEENQKRSKPGQLASKSRIECKMGVLHIITAAYVAVTIYLT
jgi:hypothetical protein